MSDDADLDIVEEPGEDDENLESEVVYYEAMCVNARLGQAKYRRGTLIRETPERLRDLENVPEGTFRRHAQVPIELLERLRDQGRVVD